MKKRIKPLITVLLVVAMLLPNFSMMIVPNVANLVASAAEGEPYTVELAFNNIFVFEKWANNDLSSTVINGAGVPKQGGNMTTDIENGSFRLTKTDMVTNEIFTAFSMGTESASQNANYYTMPVKPGTSYNFSYNYTGTAENFTPFVFMFTTEGLFAGIDKMVSYKSPAKGDNSFTFTTPANVTSIQIRFTIGDNNTNSSASSVYADVKNIVIQETIAPAESPNLFRFDDWAANSTSAKIQTANGTLTTDTDANSFTITKTGSGDEAYTGFSMSSDPAGNTGYYTMNVEASTDYSFLYDISNITASNFIAFVFFFDSSNKYISLVNYGYRGTSFHRLDFTTPANATHIQVRFGIADSATSVSATVKDIVICKTEEFENIFDFDTWSTKSDSGAGISGVYGGADSSINAGSQSITLTSKRGAAGLTNFSTGTFGDNAYVIETDPGKSYLVSYDLSVGSGVAPGELSLLVAWYNSSKAWDMSINQGYTQLPSTAAGGNHFTFTVPANAEYFQIVFGLYNTTVGASATISNIEFYDYVKPDLSEYVTDPEAPHEYYSDRRVYTYTPGGDATYGSLPEPPAASIPSGYVFAGWYTGENGTGTRINADTPVSFASYTVFPKYEPAVDTLTLVSAPAKTVYTVGEKLNTEGLVLQATINGADGTSASTFNITSGVYCTPQVLNTAGTQTITASYGGKTVTFNVTVNAYNETNITVNGASHPVQIANNKYTLDYSTTPFNRYELTYYSDSYVKGVITMDADTEEFFLEPSDNGRFSSYIDSFLRGINHYSVVSIEFTCLDKEFGNFELYSVTTIAAPVPSNTTQYYENTDIGYKVGISLDFGGVVSEIYDLDDPVVARIYNINGKQVSKVDYESKLDENYGTNYISQSDSVNLINTNDKGRFLQQSYYGTNQPPFVMGDYNGVPWNYNPVQGGNLNHFDPATGEIIKGGEASKVIDYRITDTEIYVKTRPLDWGKNSVDYPDSYVTDSYMEAWYVFEDGMIKTYCRFVDFSGYPSNTTTQELPALYTIEPLNNYVYYAGGTAWDRSEGTTQVKNNVTEPDFWGVLPSYNQYNPNGEVDVDVDCNENWAAFTASPDADSFGIGVYSAGITDFHYGCFPAKYEENQYKAAGEQDATVDGGYVAALKAGTQNSYTHVTNDRHAVTLNPAVESPTSYIAPIGETTFESFKPMTYSFYVTTGTEAEIREDFEFAVQKDEATESAETEIAVPETVYMTPANGASTKGQYYVNNKLDLTNGYEVVTVAEADDKMYLGIHIDKAESFVVNVTNTTSTGGEIYLGSADGETNYDGQTLYFDSKGTYIVDEEYGLHFSGTGLQPGEKTTAKWEITATLEDGSTVTYTVFSVLYAPGRTVGAVAEARQVAASQHEISSWITGATGVDHSTWSPLGSLKGDYKGAGYFTNDPLYNENAPTGGSGGTATDYIEEQITGADVDNNVYNENNYVMQTATNDHDSSRARSYLGLLTIDKSRYTNTNQIPNLRIGYDVLRIGSYVKNSLGKYNTYYTLGTDSSYTATSLSEAPSGWSTYSSYTDIADSKSIPYRESFVPAFEVSSDIDGMYIHALNQGKADQNINTKQYATAGTSVLIDITDKSALRDAVTNGYSQPEDDPDFLEKLEQAATVLGDPTATQDEIDEATKDLNNAIEGLVETFYALKYDNLFSAYEFSQHPNSMSVVSDRGTVTYNDGTITVVNEQLGTGITEVYTNYGSGEGNYLIDLKPNTEYIFKFTVTTDVKAQAFIFFYDANGGSGSLASNISVQTNGGAWATKNESNPWIGHYPPAGTNTYTIRFTTGANTYKAAFRFGNTDNGPVTSTFSNIKLIDAAHYYEEVTYLKTEDVYLEFASYGTLPTLTRTGYTFAGWADAAGNAVTGASIATEHKTIYSVWTEHRYTIVYNSNGGSGSISGTTVDYTQTVALASSGFTKSGKKLAGWSTDPNASSVEYALGESVSKLTDTKNGTVTLYAVWTSGEVNVTFDNLVDMKAWQASGAFTANANINNVTNTGFSVSNTANGAEKTVESTEFPVTAGKQYKIDIDITGDSWDVYIFFRSATVSGTGIGFNDGTNRYSYGGTGNASQIFTAPEGATKAVIRVDANQKSTAHTVNFENVRVYEYDGISPVEVTPSNKYYNIDAQYGTLPTPTKEGFTFAGWVDENGNAVTSTSTVPNNDADGVIRLTSTWKINNNALESDKTVIDFSASVAIDAIGNDTILNDAATAYKTNATITGVSTNGTSFAATATGTYGTFKIESNKVVYTPTAALDGVEKVYYQTKLNSGYTDTVTSEIVVVPASNVLYEETVFETKNAASTDVKWTTVADENATPDAYQGVLKENEKEVYGYDSIYANSYKYSNGKALNANVTASSKRSQILSFTFKGTGFDLYSVCGPTTGVQVVTLKNETTGAFVKSYIVDTYYNDFDGTTLNQVPIISENNLSYAKYSIQVIASYLPSMSGALKTQAVESVDGMTVNTADANSNELREALAQAGLEYVYDAESVDVVWFDDNSVLNGGTGAETPATDVLETASTTTLLNYVDAVRVYKPVEDGNTYYIASETNAKYYNVMDNLLSNANDTGITGNADRKYIAYVSGNAEQEITVDNYNSIGPKDEVYLAKTTEKQTGLTFTVKNFDKDAMNVMVSLRAAYGTPKAKFGNDEFTVSSSTEMYYDITDYVADDGTVTIQNSATDTSLLSVVAIKITSETMDAAALSTDFNLMTARTMMMAPATEVEPNTSEVPDEPEEPVVPDEPEVPEVPDEPDDTAKSWIVRLIEWVIATFNKLFATIRTVLGF